MGLTQTPCRRVDLELEKQRNRCRLATLLSKAHDLGTDIGTQGILAATGIRESLSNRGLDTPISLG
jgi:hypothetical protein